MKPERGEDLVRPRSLKGALLFAAPALVGVLLVAAVIAWKQELFVSRTPIYAFTDSALGIRAWKNIKRKSHKLHFCHRGSNTCKFIQENIY